MEKINQDSVSKHSLILVMQSPFDIDNPIEILFDEKCIATAYYDEKYHFLFLENINLEIFKLDRKNIGTITINYLGEYFSRFTSPDDLLLIVQYDNSNTSKEFYKKIGFKNFEKTKEYAKNYKDDVYFIIDRFCDDRQILYKKIIPKT